MATSSGVAIGGYDCEHFIDHLSETVQCSICMLVPRDPYYTKCCNKKFCGSCLEHLKLTSTNYSCPNCRSSLTNNSCRDVSTNEIIKKLRVYCNHKNGGCQWSGSIREIEEHLQKCSYQQKECPNKCSELIYPVELEEHLNEKCTHRPFTCSYCNMTDIYKVITGNHYSVCPEVPIPCPNKECDEIRVRKEMISHRKECPKERVSCPYAKVGCQKNVKREDLVKHDKEDVRKHLTIAMERIEELSLESIKVSTRQASQNVIKFNQFTKLKQANKAWQSPGIYTSPGGYKMCLSVYANGNGEVAANLYVSCFVHLMSGEYDDILEWPFQGEVTIELLNQLENRNHEKEIFRFLESTPVEYRQRIRDKGIGRGGGLQQFIPHSQLGYNSSLNCQYLKDDTLYFRVSVKVTSKTKPWLV